MCVCACVCVGDCFTIGPWAAVKCSWKPHNSTRGIYTPLWMSISARRRLTHRSDMQPASLCVCTLPHALSVCIRAPGPGLAVYLGMWNLGGVCVCVCVCVRVCVCDVCTRLWVLKADIEAVLIPCTFNFGHFDAENITRTQCFSSQSLR